MKTKPEDMAFAIENGSGAPGLTKREYFAAMAMQGMVKPISGGRSDIMLCHQYQYYAEMAVGAADALLSALNEPTQPK